MPNPWQLDTADPEFIEKLLDAIVGFTIEISSIEGKWKLNQNHSEERRQKVVDGLKTHPDEGSANIAALIAGNARRSGIGNGESVSCKQSLPVLSGWQNPTESVIVGKGDSGTLSA